MAFTMNCTWAFSACPWPVTAAFTVVAESSTTGTPSFRGGHHDRAADLAQLEGALGVRETKTSSRARRSGGLRA